jgi:hypothetical protein
VRLSSALSKRFGAERPPRGWSTTKEIAKELGLWRQHAWLKLERMTEEGTVEKKKYLLKVGVYRTWCNIWRVKRGNPR